MRLWTQCRTIAVQAISLALESQELQQLAGHLDDQREDQRTIINSFAISVLHLKTGFATDASLAGLDQQSQ